MEIRRRLYRRGSSHETTLPKPLLFSTEPGKKYDVIFTYDPAVKEWRIRLEERAP